MSDAHALGSRSRSKLLVLSIVSIGAAVACSEGGIESGSAPASPAWNLILLTADTWRGDYIGNAVSGVPLTPNLDAFVRKAIQFVEADSVATSTTPGIAGILTGLYPARSGVVSNAHLLPPELPTLATLAEGGGLQTLAVVANPVVAPGFGFERGFSDYSLADYSRGMPYARADAIVDRGLARIDGRPGAGRFFLWLHFMDPHGPYKPPAEVDRLFDRAMIPVETDAELLERGDNTGWGGIPHYQWAAGQNAIVNPQDYVARYAAEVRFLDQEVGRLLTELERRGLLEDSVVVLTADHGEALANDSGYFFSHGHDLTRDQVHVPLVLYYPGCKPAVVSRPVSTADVLPTVARLAGLQEPLGVDGRDLLTGAERFTFSQSYLESAVRLGSWRLRWRTGEGPHRLSELSRGGEVSHAPSSNAALVRQLQSLLDTVTSRPPLAYPANREELDPERAKALKALGYL